MRTTLLCLVVVIGCSSSKEERENPWLKAAKQCPDAELACARPILRVDSLKASQAYYRDALGFKIDWEHGDPPNFGSVSRSDLVLFMCEQCAQIGAGSWSMTFAKDLDALYEDFKKRGALIKMPPTKMPWGLREMHVADLDGNMIRFGHGDD